LDWLGGAEVSDPLIRAAGLKKSYAVASARVDALRGVTIEVARGEFLAIMGPSGSGKSTLLNLLGLLDQPSEGTYFLDGNDVARRADDERARVRRRHLGFVFQSFNLLARSTALENVELPLVYEGVGRRERQRRASAALDFMGLGDRQNHWPQQLSGGEQQRVAIARALVNDPMMILADEPTGALDSTARAQIMALFQALNDAGRTVILVTHDPHIARFGRRVVRMQDGCAVGEEPIRERALAAHRAGPAKSLMPA
jgi:putative ABC transport system ATP-binding protein